MRLLDPLTGIRLAYGNWILHAGYLITIARLPRESFCDWRYGICLHIMLASHALELILSLIGFIAKKCGYHFFNNFAEGVSMFMYHGAIFWTQT